MMGHHSKNLSPNTKRRFVLADKLKPKADHEVVQNESHAFGGPTPVQRKVVQTKAEAPSADLQDSIKSILSKFE